MRLRFHIFCFLLVILLHSDGIFKAAQKQCVLRWRGRHWHSLLCSLPSFLLFTKPSLFCGQGLWFLTLLCNSSCHSWLIGFVIPESWVFISTSHFISTLQILSSVPRSCLAFCWIQICFLYFSKKDAFHFRLNGCSFVHSLPFFFK